MQTAYSSDLEVQIRPLSAIDKQYMEQQRATVEGLANRLGRRLSGVPARDLDTLQIIIDRRWIDQEDAKTQQAMGIVFGDLLVRSSALTGSFTEIGRDDRERSDTEIRKSIFSPLR